MIFSQYRDSVAEITDILKQHDPMVKAMSFIGQSSTGKATKGFTQKEQLKVRTSLTLEKGTGTTYNNNSNAPLL